MALVRGKDDGMIKVKHHRRMSKLSYGRSLSQTLPQQWKGSIAVRNKKHRENCMILIPKAACNFFFFLSKCIR
ncbi:hypothetical protein TNCT_224291 [Trichonephila clavata]|uniref:Uncharacterized protein n=1 Tax=Trichonephila clavata TaxID=2740835 RepID=A0A8X6LSU1_TRICU|nr:hypothetical protein TNCT_224291 [Trichonephila clavata]